eukprot:jgi/Ulvmu1/4864/UM020_0150.1
MATPTLTAAERRKQKILQRGDERMAKVLGTYGQDAESISYTPSQVPDATETGQGSPSPCTDAALAALRDQPKPVLSKAYQRGASQKASGVTFASSVPEPAESPAQSRAEKKVTADTTEVTIASAMQAASFQMLPLRFVCAVGIAVAATSYDWFMPGVSLAVQVMAANIVLIISAAWMLKKDPERCRSIMQQVHIRQGKFLDGAFSIVSKVIRVPPWFMRVGFTVAWALYVDSGTYIAAAIVCYLFNGSPVAAPLSEDLQSE